MFSKKWLKILLIVFVSLVILFIFSILSIFLYKYYETTIIDKNKPKEENIVDTIATEIKQLGYGDLTSEIKWDNGYLYFRIFFSGDNYNKIKKTLVDDYHYVTIMFKDKDRFNIVSFQIGTKHMVHNELGYFNHKWGSCFQYEDKIKLDKNSYYKIDWMSSSSNFLYK